RRAGDSGASRAERRRHPYRRLYRRRSAEGRHPCSGLSRPWGLLGADGARERLVYRQRRDQLAQSPAGASQQPADTPLSRRHRVVAPSHRPPVDRRTGIRIGAAEHSGDHSPHQGLNTTSYIKELIRFDSPITILAALLVVTIWWWRRPASSGPRWLLV